MMTSLFPKTTLRETPSLASLRRRAGGKVRFADVYAFSEVRFLAPHETEHVFPRFWTMRYNNNIIHLDYMPTSQV